MKIINIYIIILLTSFISNTKDFLSEKNIIILTDSNFDIALKKYNNLLVLFYLPYNLECKKFLFEYEKASDILLKEKIYLSKININTEKNLSNKYDIKEIPRVFLFIKGEKIEYTGGMKFSDIVKWTKNKINKEIIKLKTAEEIEIYKKDKNNDVVLIYYGDNKDDINEFTKAAKINNEIPFAIVDSEELIKKYSKKGNVALYKNSENKIVEIIHIKEKNINDLINIHSPTYFMIFDEKSAEIIFGKSLSALFLFSDKKMDSWIQYEKLTKYISIKIKGRLLCVIANFNDKISSKLAEYVGIKEYNLPSVVIIETKGTLKKYKMNGEINEKNILNFIYNWENKNLTQYYKSAKEPKNNNGIILEIVGNSFKDKVINNKNDVIMLFYTQDCLNCKILIPIYEKVAKKMKEINNNILFGKINMAENEIESEDIISFPCIKYYKGLQKNKKGIIYNGDRSIDDLIKFIKQNFSNKITHIESESKGKINDL